MDSFKEKLYVLSLGLHPRIGEVSPVKLLNVPLINKISSYLPSTYKVCEMCGSTRLLVDHDVYFALNTILFGPEGTNVYKFHGNFLYIVTNIGTLKITRLNLLTFYVERLSTEYIRNVRMVLSLEFTEEDYPKVLVSQGRTMAYYTFIPNTPGLTLEYSIKVEPIPDEDMMPFMMGECVNSDERLQKIYTLY